jgi:putative ABC transport system permease protein
MAVTLGSTPERGARPARHNAGVEVADYVRFGAGLLVIGSVTVALGAWVGTGLRWFPLWALARAAVQLSVIALLLRGILAVPWTVVAFVLLMLSTASLTSVGRLRELWHGRRAAVAGVLAGAAAGLLAIFGLGLVDLEVRYLIAVAGIIIGNAMSAATLSGRSFLRAVRVRGAEIEAWLSLGATPARAHQEIGREAVRETLVPSLDQTRSTGLVTLPGAFVGALFGGASPATAAMFQLVVLAGIGLTMTVTAVVVTQVAGRTPYVEGARA